LRKITKKETKKKDFYKEENHKLPHKNERKKRSKLSISWGQNVFRAAKEEYKEIFSRGKNVP